MDTSTVPVSFRIRSNLAGKIEPLAQQTGVSPSRLIEQLLTEALRAERMLDAHDEANMALDLLLDHVRLHLEPRKDARPANRHSIREVFQQIQGTPALMKLYGAAIISPASSRVTQAARRQYVHSHIARFTKTFLGMESVREITLPRTSDELI